MSLFSSRHLVAGLAMVLSALAAYGLTPRERLEEHGPRVVLEDMIPESFGDWQIDRASQQLAISSNLTEKLNLIYSQTLARTYTNSRGERIMLSIAFGDDQSDSMQVHRPEICYPAQGLQILNQKSDTLATQFGTIPVKRLVASGPGRIEPISYWIVVGEQTVTGGLERKLAQLRYGLLGQIPGGMLVRISNVSGDVTTSYKTHDDFVGQLVDSVPEPVRHRVIGKTITTGNAATSSWSPFTLHDQSFNLNSSVERGGVCGSGGAGHGATTRNGYSLPRSSNAAKRRQNRAIRLVAAHPEGEPDKINDVKHDHGLEHPKKRSAEDFRFNV